ncbi:DMT family transporter [Helicobacter bizzozeronii]|uniref:DMT family transporter n=1 Tax=Helicobacter bizzozeronii TaxID=56877 RepID=UPI000CF14760|nr:DMT family transporter [Helicobacter bizzozeronii]
MNIRLGLLYMALSAFSLGAMNALIKIASAYYSPLENIFYRAFFTLLFLGFFYFIKPFSFRAYKKGGGVLLFWRMVVGALGMTLMCYNVYTMPLGTASAFNQSSPLYAILISFLIFKEPVSLRLIGAGVIGVLGVVFVANPHTSGLTWVQVASGVLNGVLVAIAYTSLYRLKEYYNGAFVVFIFSLCLSCIGFVGLWIDFPPFATGYHPMRFSGAWWHWDLWVLMGMGLSGTFGQYFLTKAYMIAPAGAISPMIYSRLFWSVSFGMLLGDPWLGFWEGLGMGLIVFSGVLIASYARKK